MLKISICDDSERALKIIEKYILREFSAFHETISVSAYTDASALRKDIIDKAHFDVLFLDVDMPAINGIDLAKQLLPLTDDTLLIFVSNLEGSVFRSLEARPFRFIRKSHFKEEIHETVKAILLEFNERQQSQARIFLQNGVLNVQLNPYQLMYAECIDKTVYLHMIGEIREIRYRLTDLESQLEEYGFIRIHKSFLVNYRFISCIKKTDCILDDQTILPISRLRISEVKEQFRRYLV